ncbi:MAG: hypothetical protein KGL95_01350, partial [Patescibacteria group bacterium]|nr:hypothetical protein [Patescibacteria group bacterium]
TGKQKLFGRVVAGTELTAEPAASVVPDLAEDETLEKQETTSSTYLHWIVFNCLGIVKYIIGFFCYNTTNVSQTNCVKYGA